MSSTNYNQQPNDMTANDSEPSISVPCGQPAYSPNNSCNSFDSFGGDSSSSQNQIEQQLYRDISLGQQPSVPNPAAPASPARLLQHSRDDMEASITLQSLATSPRTNRPSIGVVSSHASNEKASTVMAQSMEAKEESELNKRDLEDNTPPQTIEGASISQSDNNEASNNMMREPVITERQPTTPLRGKVLLPNKTLSSPQQQEAKDNTAVTECAISSSHTTDASNDAAAAATAEEHVEAISSAASLSLSNDEASSNKAANSPEAKGECSNTGPNEKTLLSAVLENPLPLFTSNDAANATGAKDNAAMTERPSATRPRGKVLLSKRKTLDSVEYATIGKKEVVDKAPPVEKTPVEIPPVEKPEATSSAPLLDEAGNPSEYNQNDVFLTLSDPNYKAVLFTEFKKLGPVRSERDNVVVDELFQRFKIGGGRFFKQQQYTQGDYVEVDETTAAEKIKADIRRRMETSRQWLDNEVENPGPSMKLSAPKAKAAKPLDNDLILPSRSSRKRSKPQNFADAQGQDLLIQEDLREQAKRRKKSSDIKPFSANESRGFELGCVKHGWGNWEQVLTFINEGRPAGKGRTVEECESHAAMVMMRHPEVKERLNKEHNDTWVYTRGVPPPTAGGGGDDMMTNARKSSRARKPAAHYLSETTTTATTAPNKKKVNATASATNGAKPKRKRKPKRSTENNSEDNGGRKSNNSSDAPAAASSVNTGRPKRQSAVKARKVLRAATADDATDDDDDSDRGAPAAANKGRRTRHSSANFPKSRAVNNELLEGLSSVPSNNAEYYEEESAWRFHNPAFTEDSEEQLTAVREGVAIPYMSFATPAENLQPLPRAPPLPKLPETGFCTWSFDEKSRVLLANFQTSSASENKEVKVTREDEDFLFRMMERDDITVVSEGLADSINSSLWTREYIEGCIGSDYHHKFRGFETILQDNGPGKQPTELPKEKAGWYSMKVSDYFQYLEQRRSVNNAKYEKMEVGDLSKEFTFTDSNDRRKSVDVEKESLYMIDVDMVKLLPGAFEDFQRNFKLPGILPGGSHCMMNAVNTNGRPFMGPNLYITPTNALTHFHQDGHGTVDSGHLCLSGYNEVIMLRRLTERHKCHALQLLTGTSDSYSTLYGLPHRDDFGTQPGWPSNEAIRQCEEMKYYPSVFILKAGQLVHINKGRLHAFRKLAPSALPDTDCHSHLRNQVLQTKEKPTEDICFSVAWDWMFKGVTSDGINREVSGILECSRLNREHHLQSLAIPEASLLFLAKENIAKYRTESKNGASTASLFQLAIPQHPSVERSEPDAVTVLQGILPSLHYVVNRHNSAVNVSQAWEKKTKDVTDSSRVSIDTKPNTWQDPGAFTLDPYGAGDFFCKFCSEELSNVYMHCDGCEKLLNKDFNICYSCHMEEKYKVFLQMHPCSEKPQSILNHTGNKIQLRQAYCPCKNGKPCIYCKYCTGCSCRCHQWFTLHYRFMGLENELEILKQAEEIVGTNMISQSKETKARLLSLLPGELPQDEGLNDSICPVINSTPLDIVDKEVNEGRSRNKKEKEIKGGYRAEEGEAAVDQINGKTDELNSDGGQGGKEARMGVAGATKNPTNASNGHTTAQMNQSISEGRPSEVINEPAPAKEPAPDIGEGWTQQMIARPSTVKSGKIKYDRYFFSPEGRKFSSRPEVQRYFDSLTVSEQETVQTDATDDPERCSFYCNKCDRDMVFTSRKAAPGAFASHVKWCGNKKKKRSRRFVQEPVAAQAVAGDSSDDEAVYESYEAKAIDPDKLRAGSRVLVLCSEGKGWQATIKKPHEKKGVMGHMIHYDGLRKSAEHWVATESIVDFLHEGTKKEAGEATTDS